MGNKLEATQHPSPPAKFSRKQSKDVTAKPESSETSKAEKLAISDFSIFFEKNTFIPKRMGDFILKQHKFITMRGTKPVMFILKDDYYQKQAESVIHEICKTTLSEYYRKRYNSETIDYIQASTYKSDSEIKPAENLVPLRNGVLNIETFEFTPYNDSMIFFYKLNATYDPTANCPNFKKFLNQVQEPEDIPSTQEWFGFILYPKCKFQKAWLGEGETKSGKSTLIHAAEEWVGQDNVSHISLQRITNKEFGAAGLIGKVLNTFPELPDKALWDTTIFKAITGGDKIDAPVKYKDDVPLWNPPKLMFSTNKVPESKDLSDAFFERFLLPHFPLKFVAEDRRRKPNERVVDPDLIKKLTTPEELSGILNWALEGLKRLLKQKRFSVDDEIVKMKYIHKSNSIHAYALEGLKENPDMVTPKWVIDSDYITFCRKKGLHIESKKKFTSDLPNFIPTAELRIASIANDEGKRPYQWCGIEIVGYKTEDEEMKEQLDKAQKQQQEAQKATISAFGNLVPTQVQSEADGVHTIFGKTMIPVKHKSNTEKDEEKASANDMF